jgi:hypothetical protein
MPLADHDSRKRYQYGVFATITRAIIDCEKLGLGFNLYPSILRIQAKTIRFSISAKAGMTGHGYTQGDNSISAFTTDGSAIPLPQNNYRTVVRNGIFYGSHVTRER